MKHPFSRLFGLSEKELPIEKEEANETGRSRKISCYLRLFQIDSNQGLFLMKRKLRNWPEPFIHMGLSSRL